MKIYFKIIYNNIVTYYIYNDEFSDTKTIDDNSLELIKNAIKDFYIQSGFIVSDIIVITEKEYMENGNIIVSDYSF
jgi:hypothetical protein